VATRAILLRVHIGKAPVTLARLSGGAAPALRLTHVDSGVLLWSAGALPPASQVFPGMRAAFGGSLTAIDLDGDGMQDRLYAGDLAGRLWRFDIHHGADAGSWLTGGIFADLGHATGRGFVAAPDISLGTAEDGSTWFNIAAGTASTGMGIARNRFYVLRDHAAFESWSDTDYARWTPLRETDLSQRRPADDSSTVAPDGYFIELAHGEVLAASITLAGRAVIAVSEQAPGGGCQVPVTVSAIDLETGRALPASTGGPTQPPLGETVRGLVPAGAELLLETTAAPAIGCRLGDTRIAACDIELPTQRTWWRREDAE
jgi:hypothetical protein